MKIKSFNPDALPLGEVSGLQASREKGNNFGNAGERSHRRSSKKSPLKNKNRLLKMSSQPYFSLNDVGSINYTSCNFKNK